MKKTIILLSIFSLFSCSTTTYTSDKYFNCAKKNTHQATTEKQKLIYEILKRSVVDLKDVPSYGSLKDKKKIYINRTYYSELMSGIEKPQTFQFENNEIPTIINDVQFCIKSKEELQQIADYTTDFIYLTLANIKITEDIATIAVDVGWQSQSNSKIAYLSGGGYLLQYKKVNDNWIFDKELSNWIS